MNRHQMLCYILQIFQIILSTANINKVLTKPPDIPLHFLNISFYLSGNHQHPHCTDEETDTQKPRHFSKITQLEVIEPKSAKFLSLPVWWGR